jgi:hypothetical protein
MNPAALIFWIAACVAIPFIAKDKKPGPVAIFFICLFLSPLIGLIVALCAKKKPLELSETTEEASSTVPDNQE